jgi:hypothetical protein
MFLGALLIAGRRWLRSGPPLNGAAVLCLCAASCSVAGLLGCHGGNGELEDGGGAPGGPDATKGTDGHAAGDARQASDAAQGQDAGQGALTNARSITKDGVTWTFSTTVPVGQFVNGDYYVVGPVTVTEISPMPQSSFPYMNGSVLDLPTKDGKSAFDARLNDGTAESSYWFNAAERANPPLSLKPGDSLVSSISLAACDSDGGACAEDGGACEGSGVCEIPSVMSAGNGPQGGSSPVASASILTVLGAAASVDAFRPSYCDRDQTLYHANALERSLLPSLPAPPSAAGTPPLSTFENWMRRPWIDMNPFLFDAPAEYMPNYGARVASVDSYVGLLLELDFPASQKVTLTNYFVQYAVDLFGCLKAGYGWPAFGGHRSGRKMPIVFAGILFGDKDMQNVSTLYPNQFGEDMQTVYVDKIPGGYTQAWNGAKVIYGGHYGVTDGTTPVSPGLYGPYEQLPPSNTNWPLLNGNEQLGEAYRRCCTSLSWIGEALAMRILGGGQSAWNYPAFFDYADRWMDEPDTQTISDPQAIQDILKDTGFSYTANWEAQGQVEWSLQGEFPQYTFIDDMWKAYRSMY